LFPCRSIAAEDEARGSRRFVMEFPEGLKYSKEHEWVLLEGNTATIGITEYAQEELGDIVYVELPEVGEKVVKDDPFGAVESVKAVSDVYAPVSGSVLEINDVLPDNPETINDDPYGDGWMIRVELSDADDLADLMDAEEYAEYVQQQKENDDEEDEDEEDEDEVDEEDEEQDK
jgi:glycine cleavage system H protein